MDANQRDSVVLLDGGMGQELVRRSGAKPHPLWSAKVLVEQPDLVRELHRDFIAAGARVITINAYSATPERLERYGLKSEFERLQRSAIDLAFSARDQAATAHDVRIAGCLPPLFGTYHPEIAPAFDECLYRYREIVETQAASVDLFMCETMSSAKEAKAATIAALESGKEIWTSLSLDDRNSFLLRSGEPAIDVFTSIDALGVSALLINCSMPETISAQLSTLTKAFPRVGAYGNGFTSVDALEIGGVVDVLEARKDLSPEQYAAFAVAWADAGAKIVGGCCEIGPDHIREIGAKLQELGFRLSAQLPQAITSNMAR
jgi:S-methylmethionine-dependent homocysteine/selenocysteine methylase